MGGCCSGPQAPAPRGGQQKPRTGAAQRKPATAPRVDNNSKKPNGEATAGARPADQVSQKPPQVQADAPVATASKDSDELKTAKPSPASAAARSQPVVANLALNGPTAVQDKETAGALVLNGTPSVIESHSAGQVVGEKKEPTEALTETPKPGDEMPKLPQPNEPITDAENQQEQQQPQQPEQLARDLEKEPTVPALPAPDPEALPSLASPETGVKSASVASTVATGDTPAPSEAATPANNRQHTPPSDMLNSPLAPNSPPITTVDGSIAKPPSGLNPIGSYSKKGKQDPETSDAMPKKAETPPTTAAATPPTKPAVATGAHPKTGSKEPVTRVSTGSKLPGSPKRVPIDNKPSGKKAAKKPTGRRVTLSTDDKTDKTTDKPTDKPDKTDKVEPPKLTEESKDPPTGEESTPATKAISAGEDLPKPIEAAALPSVAVIGTGTTTIGGTELLGWYVVVGQNGAVVRDSVDTTGPVVAQLKRDDRAYVTAVKGRRAFLAEHKGWASVTNGEGHAILTFSIEQGPPPPNLAPPEEPKHVRPAPLRSSNPASEGCGSDNEPETPDTLPANLKTMGYTGGALFIRLDQLHITIDETYTIASPERHERYIIEVASRENKSTTLWRVTRRFTEMKYVFEKLAAMDTKQHPLPRVPVEDGYMMGAMKRMGGLWRKNQEDPLVGRMKGFQDLFNAVLQDSWLSGHPDFLKLLGAPTGIAQGEPLTEQSFANQDVAIAPDFKMTLRAGPRPGDTTFKTTPFPGKQNGTFSDTSSTTGLLSPVSEATCKPTLTPSQTRTWQKVGKPLGRGAFGVVHLAQLSNSKQVAVKEIALSDAPTDAARQNFEQEFALMQRLHHPNIVQYLGHRWSDNKYTLHIFLEFVTGGSVADLVKKVEGNCLQPTVIRNYIRQVLEGLEYLHKGDATRPAVVHRDIKGDNLLVGKDGEVKLADFGCSKMIGERLMGNNEPNTTFASGTGGAGTMVGTPFWMAPEVISPQENGGTYGTKCDIWSLGCTIIEMFGKVPWANLSASSPWEVMYSIANSEAGPEIPSAASENLKSFCSLCFIRDARKRASATALLTHPYITCDDEEC
ncbi:hypothetical protein DIPPA_65076 [Diplonema papillatum]|nr:hypothetical protein DIPPA_65076 [Diplonema papillatum]